MESLLVKGSKVSLKFDIGLAYALSKSQYQLAMQKKLQDTKMPYNWKILRDPVFKDFKVFA